MRTTTIDRRLLHHLVLWLGRWPANARLDVVGSSRRTEPGWDGRLYPAVGVFEPDAGVISVPPAHVDGVRLLVDQLAEAHGLADRLPALLEKLPAALDEPGWRTYQAVFRWSTEPADLPDAGEWRPSSSPGLPEWLGKFPGEVLVALDPRTGGYLGGVGLKPHNGFGQEIAVGTDEAARGRGLARRLVAQAARKLLAENTIPTYVHDPENVASARVAVAAGFPDRGWTVVAMLGESPE